MCVIINSPFTFYIIIIALFGAYMYFIQQSNLLFDPVFFERDPTLSYSVVHTQVSNTMLALLSSLVPVIFIVIVPIVYENKTKYRLTTFFWILIGFIITLASTSAFTNTIKLLIAEPRPSFFAICNYYGYKTAYIQNNFTNYNTLTVQNKIGSIENCNASVSDIKDAFLSFPSGHASLMFSSMTYLSCIIHLIKHLKIEIHFSSIKSFIHLYETVKIITVGSFALASWVAITRVQDYEHHTFDILAGAVLGIVISLGWWNIIKYKIMQTKLVSEVLLDEIAMGEI